MKWHSLVDVNIPFLSVPYNRGDDFFRFPFDFTGPVADSMGTFITQWAIHQDQDKGLPV